MCLTFGVDFRLPLSLCCSVANRRNPASESHSPDGKSQAACKWRAECVELWRDKTTAVAGFRSVWLRCSSTMTLSLLCYYSIIQSASSGPEGFTPVYTQLVQLPPHHKSSACETSKRAVMWTFSALMRWLHRFTGTRLSTAKRWQVNANDKLAKSVPPHFIRHVWMSKFMRWTYWFVALICQI